MDVWLNQHLSETFCIIIAGLIYILLQSCETARRQWCLEPPLVKASCVSVLGALACVGTFNPRQCLNANCSHRCVVRLRRWTLCGIRSSGWARLKALIHQFFVAAVTCARFQSQAWMEALVLSSSAGSVNSPLSVPTEGVASVWPFRVVTKTPCITFWDFPFSESLSVKRLIVFANRGYLSLPFECIHRVNNICTGKLFLSSSYCQRIYYLLQSIVQRLVLWMFVVQSLSPRKG